jgi:Fe-S cluster biogenesis protein NfuA
MKKITKNKQKRNSKRIGKEKSVEERVEEILAKVRPYVQMHGGDVILRSIRENKAVLYISGACAHCSLSDLTYNNLIASVLRDEIKEIEGIIIEK